MRVLIINLLFFLGACGSSPTPKVKTPTEDPLAAELARRATGKLPPKAAVVTYAVLLNAPPGDSEALKAQVDAAFKSPSPELAAVVKAIDVRPALILVGVPVEGLPINLDALLESAGPHRSAAKAATHAVFIRYVGAPLVNADQIRGAELAAIALAGSGVIVDLSTRRWFNGPELTAQLTAANWEADQVTVYGEQLPDDRVLFASLGMAKFGLPDVEVTGVPLSIAAQQFGNFQRLVNAVRAQGYVVPGDTVGTITVTTCTRDSAEYDHECVGFALDGAASEHP